MDPLNLLLQASLLRHHALIRDFKPLIEGILLLFEPSDRALELVDGGSIGFLALFELFFELLLKLLEHRVVVVLVLGFRLVLGPLQLVNGLLELTESVLVVLLSLFFLLLEELKLTLPKRLLFLELTLQVSVLPLHLVVLGLPVLHLLSDAKLPLGQSLVELLVLLLQLQVFDLIGLDQLLLLSL